MRRVLAIIAVVSAWSLVMVPTAAATAPRAERSPAATAAPLKAETPPAPDHGLTLGFTTRLPGRGYSLYPYAAQTSTGAVLVWRDGEGIQTATVSDSGVSGIGAGASIAVTAPSINFGDTGNSPVVASGQHVYVVWSAVVAIAGHAGQYEGAVFIAASSDGGASFGQPKRVSSPGHDAEFPLIAANGSNVAIAWTRYSGGVSGAVYFATSDDGGASFAAPLTAVPSPSLMTTAASASMTMSTPRTYLSVAPGYVGGDVAKAMLFSIGNDGKGARLVPLPHPGRIAAVDDTVAVAWMQDDSTSTVGRYRPEVVASIDGGRTFTSSGEPVGDDIPTGQAPGNYHGQYDIDIAVGNGRFYVAWNTNDSVRLAFTTNSDGTAFGHDTVASAMASSGYGQLHLSVDPQVVAVSWAGPAGNGGASTAIYAAAHETGADGWQVSHLKDASTSASFAPTIAAFDRFFVLGWSNYPDRKLAYTQGVRSYAVVGTSADQDLAIEDVRAAQAAAGYDKLVAGKPTAVAVRLRSGFVGKRSVTFRLAYTTGTSSTPVTKDYSVLVDPEESTVYLPPGGQILPAAPTATFSVTIDPDNAVGESDETNNTAVSPSYPVKTAKPYSVLFVPVQEPGDAGPTCADVQRQQAATVPYLQGAFPISSITAASSCTPLVISSKPPYTCHVLTCDLPEIGRQLRALDPTRTWTSIVGIVKPGFFKNDTDRYQGALDLAFHGSRTGVLVEADELGGWPVAHELSHDFGWVSKGFVHEDPTHRAHLPQTPAPGYWVQRHTEITGALDYMYWSTQGANVNKATDRWIGHDTYDFLFHQLVDAPDDPHVLSLTGEVDATGAFTTDAWYALDGIPTQPLGQSGGAYTLDELNAAGDVIASTTFDAAGDPDGTPADGAQTSLLSLSVPLATGTASVRISKGGATVYQRDRSEHAPAVSIDAPAGGSSQPFGTPVTVSWTGSDADDDTLTYTVSTSTDGGTTWVPIASDLATTSVAFTPTSDQFGSMQVRVMASDGWNTSTATSDPFTIAGHVQGGRIAFVRYTDVGVQKVEKAGGYTYVDTFDNPANGIWTVNPDGTGLTQLTHPVTDDGELGFHLTDYKVDWSPDGSKIAFVGSRCRYPDGGAQCNGSGVESGLWEMNADGSDPTLVYDQSAAGGSFAAGRLKCPEWSPDGGKIAFTGQPGSNAGYTGLYTVDVDDSALHTVLAAESATTSCPQWFPDGNRLLYRWDGTPTTVNLDGSNRQTWGGLSNNIDFPYIQADFADLSPDGTTLAGGAPLSSLRAIYTETFDGTWRTVVSLPAGVAVPRDEESFVRWSPDGTALVYTACLDNAVGCAVYTVDAQGSSAPIRVTDPQLAPRNGTAGDFAAAWQPATVVVPPDDEAPVPVADAGGPYAVAEGDSITLSAAGSAGDGLHYAWDLDGDGSYDDASGPSADVSFPAPGDYTVAVMVTDDHGLSASATATVAVTDVDPALSGAQAGQRPGGRAHLSATVTDPGPGDTLTATVDWHDGNGPQPVTVLTEGALSAAHVYAAPDAHDATVVVDDGFGGSASADVPIPAASPNHAPVAQSAHLTVPGDAPAPITVLASDPDADSLDLVPASQPQHGTVIELARHYVAGLPSFRYIPEAGYAGRDSFTYGVSDGVATSIGSVELNVGSPPSGTGGVSPGGGASPGGSGAGGAAPSSAGSPATTVPPSAVASESPSPAGAPSPAGVSPPGTAAVGAAHGDMPPGLARTGTNVIGAGALAALLLLAGLALVALSRRRRTARR